MHYLFTRKRRAAEPSGAPANTLNRLHAVLLLAALVASPAFCKPSSAYAADAAPSITVFAAASLREAFEAAAPAFTSKTGTKVTFNFAGSDTLETQIAQGAPADVFASANKPQMHKAHEAGLLLGEPRIFAQNQLAIIIPKDNPGRIKSAADLGRSGVRVVLAAPTVPVGNYARTAFANLSKIPAYGAQFAQNVEANVVSNEVDVKAVVTKISLGEADAGVSYLTDITSGVAKSVASIPFPADTAPVADYPIAIVKASKNADAAKAFIDFILSPEGQGFLKERGFIVGQPASS
jgi:molybdate transport system substrate-binding protein